MVPNRVLTRSLLAAVDGRATIIAPAEVKGLAAGGRAAELALADGRVLVTGQDAEIVALQRLNDRLEIRAVIEF